MITSEWTVIAYPQKNIKITKDEVVQERLVRKYVEYWFNIHKNNQMNEALWQKCDVKECNNPEQYEPKNLRCSLFCTSDRELFLRFTNNILPEYRNRINQKSETVTVKQQMISPPSKQILAMPPQEDMTYVWQSYVTLESSVNKTFEVLVFVELGYDKEGNYPATLGYYVKDFNAYNNVEILCEGF